MPKRVLLVDDHWILRRTARDAFESAGYVCDEAEDGVKAIDKAAAFKPDLIVLDLAMPNMNGLEAAPVLRKMLPSVPIILFTLYAGSILEKNARKAGITLIVAKDEAKSKLLTEAKYLLEEASS